MCGIGNWLDGYDMRDFYATKEVQNVSKIGVITVLKKQVESATKKVFICDGWMAVQSFDRSFIALGRVFFFYRECHIPSTLFTLLCVMCILLCRSQCFGLLSWCYALDQ